MATMERPRPTAPQPGVAVAEAIEEDECTICLEPFVSPGAAPVTMACGHAFHGPCIGEWSKNSPFCPLCRRTLALLPPPVPVPVPVVGAGHHNLPGPVKTSRTPLAAGVTHH